jgi:hypothetical protein
MTVLAQLISTEAPRLPALVLSSWWLHLGWAVVLAWLAAGIGRWLGLSRAAQLGLAAALGLWTCVPGPYAPGHWLGLAFQAPSISLVVLCAWSFYRSVAPMPALPRQEQPAARGLALAGILLGWVLLLDTLAVLPVAVYAWGFSPAIPALALLAVLLPWVLRQGAVAMAPAVVLLVIAVLAYVVLRLPSGNAWDALLDPWLWLALHIMAIRSWRARSGSIPS